MSTLPYALHKEKSLPLRLPCQKVTCPVLPVRSPVSLGRDYFLQSSELFRFPGTVTLTGAAECYNICSSVSVWCSFSDKPISELALASLIIRLDPGQKSGAGS